MSESFYEISSQELEAAAATAESATAYNYSATVRMISKQGFHYRVDGTDATTDDTYVAPNLAVYVGPRAGSAVSVILADGEPSGTITISDVKLHFSIDSVPVAQRGFPAEITGPAIVGVFGQSNAVGSDTFDSGQAYPDGVMQLNQSGEIVAATVPLDHVDETPGDMGFALQFAIAFMRRYPNATLILVPHGKSGSGFSNDFWNPVDSLYSDAVARIILAKSLVPNALMGGTLWQQGESDVGIPVTYPNLLYAMIDQMLVDVTGPFVAGGFCDEFIINSDRQEMDDAMAAIPDNFVNCAYVDTANLTLQGDNLHFDSESLRKLGSRYFDSWESARGNNGSIPASPAVPNKVITFDATPAATTVALAWTAPVFDGESTITDYVIERKFTGGNFSVVASGIGAVTSHNDTGLAAATSYQYRISAINAIGASVASNIEATATLGFTFAANITNHIDVSVGSDDLVGSATVTFVNSAAIVFDSDVGKNVISVPAADDSVELDGTADLIASSYSKLVWVKFDSLAGNMNVWSAYYAPVGTHSHLLWVPSNAWQAAHNGAFDQVASASPAPAIDTWYHFAVTYDAASTTMKEYVDGVEIDENTSVADPTAWHTRSYLGDLSNSGGAGILGRIGVATLVDRALTPTEIAEHITKTA